VVCFGSDGVLVFTVIHMGVVTQQKSKAAPFFDHNALHGTPH
jgi:hypothetical protein